MIQEWYWGFEARVIRGVSAMARWLLWALIKWAVVPVDAYVCGYHSVRVKAWVI